MRNYPKSRDESNRRIKDMESIQDMKGTEGGVKLRLHRLALARTTVISGFIACLSV